MWGESLQIVYLKLDFYSASVKCKHMPFYKFLAFSLCLHSLIFIDLSGSLNDFSLKKSSAVSLEFKKTKENLNTFPNRNIKKTTPSRIKNQTQNSKTSTLQTSKSYINEFTKYIQTQAVYPKAALALKHEGTVVLHIKLNHSGSVIDYKILKASKHNSLNLASIKLAKNLPAYKPLPKSLRPSKDFTIPVHYIMN